MGIEFEWVRLVSFELVSFGAEFFWRPESPGATLLLEYPRTNE